MTLSGETVADEAGQMPWAAHDGQDQRHLVEEHPAFIAQAVLEQDRPTARIATGANMLFQMSKDEKLYRRVGSLL